jgi:tetratricopeptide (TPR) repeat protein
MQGDMAIATEDIEGGIAHCDRAYGISRRINDSDLEALAMATRGHGLMASGHVAAATGCHQEAAALVMSGGVSAEHGGYVMCSVITSAVNRGDWACARQWTEQFTRWCERFGKSSYPGLCQLHRAEMLHFNGELPRALAEAETACRILKDAAPWAEGDAWRVLGDIHLAQGDLAAAEAAYHNAYGMGWDPQPGLAWMHFASGNADTAIAGLQRAIESSNWFNRERRILLQAELVALAVDTGNETLARETLNRIEQNPDLGLPMQKALLARARSRVAAHAGQYPQAMAFVQEARRHWLDIGATLNAATEHMAAARMLRAMEDPVAADMELTAAARIFKNAGATGLHAQCESLRQAQ